MYRSVFVPADETELLVQLPKEYLKKKVEVIAFEVEENSKPQIEDIEHLERVQKALAVFDSMRVNTKGFKFDRDEANER